MKTISQRGRTRAFSLVEVVVAIGIFSFCVVGIVALLAVALGSSRNSQQDSAMAAILQNTISQMTALPSTTLTNLPTTNYYYDMGGNLVSSANDGFYRATVNRVSGATVTSMTAVTNGTLISPGATNSNNHFLWTLQISYPAPGYPQSKSFIFGRTLMGSVTDDFRE